MPQVIVNGIGISRIRGNSVVVSQSYDTDAQAFITATSLSDNTQKNAINDLVLDLKAAGLWTKMKALYPMVGGNATAHKFNLKDPQDTNAAFRLQFYGGWTHSASGATPNGTDGYANTFLNPSTASLSAADKHVSIYTPTNVDNGGQEFGISGVTYGVITRQSNVIYSDFPLAAGCSSASPTRLSVSNTSSNAFWVYNASTKDGLNHYYFNKNSDIVTYSYNQWASMPNGNILLGYGYTSCASRYSTRTQSFATIGGGLTQLETTVLYQIVEKYQKALSRNTNASKSFYFDRNYTNETNAFIFKADITNSTQISAIDTLVTTLKSANLWTKMNGLYPMVGGTAAAHTLNLVNPKSANYGYPISNFNLVYYGGWTHNSLGAKPNGVDGGAQTGFNQPWSYLTGGDVHFSYYNVTNNTGVNGAAGKIEMAAGSTNRWMNLYVGTGANKTIGGLLGGTVGVSTDLGSAADVRGFVVISKTATNSLKLYKNSTLLLTNTTDINAITGGQGDIRIGHNYFSDGGSASSNNYSDRQAAFISIGKGLTDAQVTTLYNAVQAFQTTLGRQV